MTRKKVRGGSFCRLFQRAMTSSRVNDVTYDDKIFCEDVNSYFVLTCKISFRNSNPIKSYGKILSRRVNETRQNYTISVDSYESCSYCHLELHKIYTSIKIAKKIFKLFFGLICCAKKVLFLSKYFVHFIFPKRKQL